MLSRQQLEALTDWQIERQQKFRSTPEAGITIKHLDKEYIVYPNVFSPIEDSELLVQHFIVNKTDTVLDLCTGTGIIGIHAACKGARNIVASDINPDAIRSAKANAKLHGFENIFDVRLSDMFDAIQDNEQFDVITCNPPFREKTATDLVESSQWDTSLHAHKRFFAGINTHLKPNGRVYLAQSNYGPLDTINQLARQNNLQIRLIAKKPLSAVKGAILYVFELSTKK